MSDGFYFLRTYVSTARIYHEHCHRCGWEIVPGEEYVGEVSVCGGHFIVHKEHYGECPREPFDDPYERSLNCDQSLAQAA